MCPNIRLNGMDSVDSLDILGVKLNMRCNWSSHFDNIVLRASRRLFALRLLRESLSKKQLTLVYNSLVRSLLEYCGPLFLGMLAKDEHRLEQIQKRFHKILCGKNCNEKCLESLRDRRLISS